MQKLFKELQGEALIEALDTNCVAQTIESVDYTLSDDDINRYAKRQQELSERETEIEDHLSEYVKPLKDELKSIKIDRKGLARITKKGIQTLDEQRIFWMQDFDNKKMLGYDCNGDLVKTRTMRKQDAQMSIFTNELKAKTS